MTPFMLAVRALLDGSARPAEAAWPELADSEAGPVAAGADRQVIVRSLAEQLVSEANAILREHGEVITLTDECGPGALRFTLGYRDREATVWTELARRTALARLVVPGGCEDRPRRLAAEDGIRALVLALVSESPGR
jgi:hypothetical protein